MLDLSRRRSLSLGLLTAIGGVSILTALLIALYPRANGTTVALVYLLLVVLIAVMFESRIALASSALAAFCFNFFFLPPYHTLNISDPANWAALFVFFAVAATVGQVSATSNRRRAEAERLLNELEIAFDKASETEALARSEKLKSALLDAVTHDLRTPLTSIKASVTMLIDEDQVGTVDSTLDSASRVELLEVINEETDRLNTFVESMVELARVQAGDVQWKRSVTTAEEIIVKAATRARSIRKDHRLRSYIEPGLPTLSVDPRAIVEAVYNILDNAAKYSPPGTAITIGAERAGNNVRFYVEDEGPGIPESRRESVFEKFYRSDRSIGGLGMGLAIVRGIIEAHGGNIWVESGTKGSRFVFDLPAERNGRETKDTRS